MPVEVLGLSDVPLAGDAFQVVIDGESYRLQPGVLNEGALKRSERLPRKYRLRICSARSRGESRAQGHHQGRCAGSVEAVRQAIEQLSTDEVRVDVIHGGVGVSVSQISCRVGINAVVIGFNVRPDAVHQCARKTRRLTSGLQGHI